MKEIIKVLFEYVFSPLFSAALVLIMWTIAFYGLTTSGDYIWAVPMATIWSGVAVSLSANKMYHEDEKTRKEN